MSQANQAVQVPTLPDMKKRVVPKVAYGEGRTWLHLPALVYMIVLTQIPFLLAVWFSLHAWNLLVPSEGFPFIGISNYVTEFTGDPNFWPIMGNTVQLVAGSIILALVGGTILALLLNRPIRCRSFWRVVFPLLRKPYQIAILFGTIFIFQTFGEIYVTTAGGPGITTNTLPYYTYRTALNSFQIGQAAALGVIGVIVAILLARGMLRLMTDRTVA